MLEGQRQLLVMAEKSIRGAEALFNDTLYGFAISRAYYAMFYIAEAFLLKEELSFSKHSAVISAFGKYFVKTGQVPLKFHQYLIDAQKDRLAGDYDPEVDFSEQKASQQISTAKEFLIYAQSYLKA